MYLLRAAVRKQYGPVLRRMAHGYPGGCPGLNLPFRRGMNSPLRFTLFWLILGTIGFGAPWLVIGHQMLRNTYNEPKEEKQQENVTN